MSHASVSGRATLLARVPWSSSFIASLISSASVVDADTPLALPTFDQHQPPPPPIPERKVRKYGRYGPAIAEWSKQVGVTESG